jgi:hypothetical protein
MLSQFPSIASLGFRYVCFQATCPLPTAGTLPATAPNPVATAVKAKRSPEKRIAISAQICILSTVYLHDRAGKGSGRVFERAGSGWVMEAYDVSMIGSGLSGYENLQFTDSDANSVDDAVFFGASRPTGFFELLKTRRRADADQYQLLTSECTRRSTDHSRENVCKMSLICEPAIGGNLHQRLIRAD